MKLNFTGANIELTQALKETATKKIEHHLAEHFKSINEAHVTFKVEREEQIAEMTLHAYGTNFHAHASDNNMYSAIDALVDKMKTQLVKQKEKITDSHHH